MCLLEIFYFEINELANGSSASSVISILALITNITAIIYAKKTLDKAEESLKIARETLGITKQDIEEKNKNYREQKTYYRIGFVFERLFPKLTSYIVFEQYPKKIKNNKEISNYYKEIEDYYKKLNEMYDENIDNKIKEIEKKIKTEEDKIILEIKENVHQKFNYIPEKLFNWMFDEFYENRLSNAFHEEENKFKSTIQNYIDQTIQLIKNVSLKDYLHEFNKLFNDDEIDKLYFHLLEYDPLYVRKFNF